MRRQRIAMVQTKEQYILCYRSVATLFEQQLKMIDAHTYENLNEDGEPLANSNENLNHNNIENGNHDQNHDNYNDDDNETEDTVDNRLVSSEKESESPVNSEDNYYPSFKPDLIKNKYKKQNGFGSLRQSRLHKSTPDFDLFQPISNDDDLIEKNNAKNEKLIGKATVIRRSSRPSIAHLKAMFENMNMPNQDGFVYNRNSKKSNLKRSMSTREKGSFNAWSSTNIFGDHHGSFENINYFDSKDSKDSDSVSDQSKQDNNDIDYYADSYPNGITTNGIADQYNEPAYGFSNGKKESIEEIDNNFIIENTVMNDQLPPPKPPRTYQQNELEIRPKPEQNQLNHIIDYMSTNYLQNTKQNKFSSSKNYYNTIGPIKRESRPSLYCFNDVNYLKTNYNSNQSKSTYNITKLHAKDNQLVDIFEPPTMSKSISINNLSNNNYTYDNPNQQSARFGILSYDKNQMHINAPLPNHLNLNAQQPPPVNYHHQQQQFKDTQDFYGQIGNNNLTINNMNNMNKPVITLQPINCQYNQQPNYQPIPTMPKPNLFSNTLPIHYNNQQHQQHQQHQQQQQQQHQQPILINNIQTQKVPPPMSYVKPTMRATSGINIQYDNRNENYFRNHQQMPVINMTNGMMNSITGDNINNNMTKLNHQNGKLLNYGQTNGHLNGIMNNQLNNQLNSQLPNSTSTISLGKLAKNYYQPNLVNQHLQSSNVQSMQSNTLKHPQSNGNLVTDKSMQTAQTPINDTDKMIKLNEQQTNRQKMDNLKESTELTSTTNKKSKRSAFNALSSIFGLRKGKKDSKQKLSSNSSTTNLNTISTSISNGNINDQTIKL